MKKKIVYISLIYILILAAFAFAIMMVLFSSNKEVEQLRNDRVVAEMNSSSSSFSAILMERLMQSIISVPRMRRLHMQSSRRKYCVYGL